MAQQRRAGNVLLQGVCAGLLLGRGGLVEGMTELSPLLRLARSHLAHSATMRSRIAGTRLEQDLHWYDLPLREALGRAGLRRFAAHHRSQGTRDDVAANHGIQSLYHGPALGDGLSASGATVWNHRGLRNDPVIHDDAVCRTLQAHAGEIVAEFTANQNQIEAHPDNADLAKNGRWSGIFLYGVKGRNERMVELFPQTFAALEQLPLSRNFGFVLVSRLAPGTHVLPHCGSSNLRFRYHLALEATEGEAVRIRVGNQWQSWRTGEAFGFDDSFEHEVRHEGQRDRTVIIVDTWNPMLPAAERVALDDPVFSRFGRVG